MELVARPTRQQGRRDGSPTLRTDATGVLAAAVARVSEQRSRPARPLRLPLADAECRLGKVKPLATMVTCAAGAIVCPCRRARPTILAVGLRASPCTAALGTTVQRSNLRSPMLPVGRLQQIVSRLRKMRPITDFMGSRSAQLVADPHVFVKRGMAFRESQEVESLVSQKLSEMSYFARWPQCPCSHL